MAFQFLIQRGGYLRRANVWYLEGELISGEVHHNSLAVAHTAAGPVSVTVKTIAFVDGQDMDTRVLTLSIEQPDCDLKVLEGTMLTAEKDSSEG